MQAEWGVKCLGECNGGKWGLDEIRPRLPTDQSVRKLRNTEIPSAFAQTHEPAVH